MNRMTRYAGRMDVRGIWKLSCFDLPLTRAIRARTAWMLTDESPIAATYGW